MQIEVTDDFIAHRELCKNTYNQGRRDDVEFLMNLDCEILERHMIDEGEWYPAHTWHIDAITPMGKRLDVKFVPGQYWTISRTKLLTILQQYRWIDYYHFCRWHSRPDRPLKTGDIVEIEQLGEIPYGTTLNMLHKSKYDGFFINLKEYFDV